MALHPRGGRGKRERRNRSPLRATGSGAERNSQSNMGSEPRQNLAGRGEGRRGGAGHRVDFREQVTEAQAGPSERRRKRERRRERRKTRRGGRAGSEGGRQGSVVTCEGGCEEGAGRVSPNAGFMASVRSFVGWGHRLL